MRGSHNNKACVWKKELKIGRGYNQNHIKVNLNGTIYNGIENACICCNLSHAPTTKFTQEPKEENPAVNDSGCKVNFMVVFSHLNNVLTTTEIINENVLMDR